SFWKRRQAARRRWRHLPFLLAVIAACEDERLARGGLVGHHHHLRDTRVGRVPCLLRLPEFAEQLDVLRFLVLVVLGEFVVILVGAVVRPLAQRRLDERRQCGSVVAVLILRRGRVAEPLLDRQRLLHERVVSLLRLLLP